MERNQFDPVIRNVKLAYEIHMSNQNYGKVELKNYKMARIIKLEYEIYVSYQNYE